MLFLSYEFVLRQIGLSCCDTYLQDGLTAVHLAACGGHASLLRGLVDTHHANVHQTAKVQQPCMRYCNYRYQLKHISSYFIQK